MSLCDSILQQLCSADNFDAWFASEFGQLVWQRINRNTSALAGRSAFFEDFNDPAQRALINLWDWFSTGEMLKKLCDRHPTDLKEAAIFLAWRAIRMADNTYSMRCHIWKTRHLEDFESLNYDDSNDERWFDDDLRPTETALGWGGRATDTHPHDKLSKRIDLVNDVRTAKELTAEAFREWKPNSPLDHRHIVEVLCEGYAYHYNVEDKRRGNFEEFCRSRGVVRSQLYIYRNPFKEQMREWLKDYAPTYPIRPCEMNMAAD